MANKLHKRIYTSLNLIKSINSRPETKVDDGSQSQAKKQTKCHFIQSLSSSSIQIEQNKNLKKKISKKIKISQLLNIFIFFQNFICLINKHYGCIVP